MTAQGETRLAVHVSMLMSLGTVAHSLEAIMRKFEGDALPQAADRARIAAMMRARFRKMLIARSLMVAGRGEPVDAAILDSLGPYGGRIVGLLVRRGALGASSRWAFRAAESVRFAIKHGAVRMRFRGAVESLRAELPQVPYA